jgi:4-hydroxy-2-oxoglutarate aldolase
MSEHNSHSTRPARLKLDGILLPFPTPFDESGNFDAIALRGNIERWNRTGVCGYVALGTTGERVHLDAAERQAVIETARDCVPPGMTFIAGIGGESTRLTITDARDAARAGADALLVITPHYYRGKISDENLAKHFLDVADAATLPILLYSIPQNTNVALAPALVARLAEHPNIIGIKDSSGDYVRLVETINRVPQGFAVLTGNASLLCAALAANATGGILAAACVAPELAVEIFRAASAGDSPLAHESQKEFSALAAGISVRYGIAGIKAALDLCGYKGGDVRLPLETLGVAERNDIKQILEARGILPAAINGLT